MIFRQLFHQETGTYTYLLASRKGGEALLIDGVLDRADRYMQLLQQLELKLVKVLDTHVHADHITAMGELRDRTECVTVMGVQAPIDVVSMRVDDGEMVTIEGIQLQALYTPGHTIDSYCYRMADRVFTGDTLLIRSTGRADVAAFCLDAVLEPDFAYIKKAPCISSTGGTSWVKDRKGKGMMEA